MTTSTSAVEFSVIIPCYNATPFIDMTLEALSRQAEAPSFEVVLVDNRSTDDLAHHVQPWFSRFESLRIVSANKAQGVSYARNVGISHARGTTIAICDADDCVSQYWLRDLSLALLEAPIVSGTAIPTLDERFTSVDEIWSWLDRDPTYLPADVPPPPEPYAIVMGGNCAFAKTLVESIGGFDQSFVAGSDDVDFGIRASRAGVPIAHSPSCRIAYRSRPTNSAVLKKNVRAGFMHARLCSRHDLWDTSPNLPPGWAWAAPRALVALALMTLKLRPRNYRSAISRLGTGLGLVAGYIWHEKLGRTPESMVGFGLNKAHKPLR